MLAQTSLAVVCAGAKAILDLPATREWLETAVSHRTRTLTMQVSFPKRRPPKLASVVAARSGASVQLAPPWSTDNRGRPLLIWRKASPEVGENYVLRWIW